MNDLISRQNAIDALWKALYDYEDKTEKQFQESDELDIYDWMQHRIFVQNISDIDRQTILNLPSAQPERRTGWWICVNESEKWECSECGRMMWFSSRLGVKSSDYRFCPNCGAGMRGEGDE